MVGFNPNAGGSGGVASDFSAQLGGIVKSAGVASGGDMSSFLGSAAGGVAALIPGLNLFAPTIGGVVGGLAGLFGGHKTDEASQTRDINTIAAFHGVTGTESAAVIADHCDHSSDAFNDLARSVAASDGLSRFPVLLAEYNSRHPNTPIRLGSVRVAAQAQAQQQQQLITTALTTSNFGASETGKQLMFALQQLPASQSVGTQGQTAGDILTAILNGLGGGAVKGASDAAAETTMGKNFKWSYVKDWIKENQLLVVGLGIVTALGLVTVINIFRGKHGKITL